MNHFQGINPDERWRNDLLNELRKLNERLAMQEAEKSEKPPRKPRVTQKGT